MVEEGARFLVQTSTGYYVTPVVQLTEDKLGVKIIDATDNASFRTEVIPLEDIESIIKEKYSQEDVTAAFTLPLAELSVK